MKKTNAMRILDRNKIKYDIKEYEVDETDLSAINVAMKTGEDVDSIFKTIVCLGNNNEYFVACVPSSGELDLKKLAKEAKVKKVELIKVKDLEKITGYIRGGCSPIGMKKEFKTFINKSALEREYIYISGGKRGVQIRLNAKELEKALRSLEFIELIQE